ncbi:MAG: reverse transcriptase domain-containing protein [Alphaproteobacteria bacterium]|nr:reverse transcriptase domain-containing protein [Alphaproteobacteria bacterium]
MKSKSIDLLALSESRWPGNGISTIRGTTILHSGTPSSHLHGVAILLSPLAKSAWDAAGNVFQPVSERILRIRLKCHFSFMSVVSVYAPTNPSSATSEAVSASEAFYDQLQSTLSSVPSSDLLVILGDFNARVGSDHSSWDSVIGPHGIGECNENGERLLDFCASNQLVVSNTWFQHKPLHQVTWFRNGDRSRPGHMIDYVLVNKRFRTSVMDTRVYRSTLHESDHELVVSSLRFKIKVKRRQTSNPRYQTTNVPLSCKASYRSTLSEAFDQTDQSSSMNSLWDIFKSSIYKACESLPPAPKSSDPDWVTDEVRNLSKKKQKAWVSLKNAPLQDNSCLSEYNRLKKLTRVAAEKARNSWWSARAAEAERRAQIAEQQGRGGSLIKDLRLLQKKFSKPASSTLVAEDGTILQTDRDKLNRWVEHFAEVVNCQVNTAVVPIDDLPVVSSLSNTSSSLSDTDLSAPLSEEEIITAISELSSGKAPGLDGISLEMLSLGEDATIYWLKSIFDAIWVTESVPMDWQSQLLVPLHKKGSRTICDNYRGIALLSIPGKVFAKAILNRIKPRAEELLRESQCGFRRGRGCADQLFSLRMLMEKAREYHHPLYACFIDLRKAYDSVNRESLWRILQHSYRLPPKLLSIIQALHEDSNAAVRAYGKISDKFPVTSGVRQGCVLAPTLFNFYFDIAIHMALDELRSQGKGIKVAYLHDADLVGNRKMLKFESLVSDLEYADDMALLADSWSDLTIMLESLSNCCQKLGLTISCKKTKSLAVLPPEQPQIQSPLPIHLLPGDEPIDVVSHFQYLGSFVQNDCGMDVEINSRICKASSAFQSLSRILWYQRKIKTNTKVRILNSVILPTLLYGLESTVLLESHVRRLESFMIRCLRIILGISVREQKRHTTIRKMAKQQRISSILVQRRLRFLGHLSRMSNDRLPKQLLVSAPVGGKRTAGGQKRRWNDMVTSDLKECNLSESWREQAQERDSWRTTIRNRVEHLNRRAEDTEKSRKDEKKRRREQRLIDSEEALHCDHPGCSFQALNKAGLINHQRSHSVTARIPCQFCHQMFHQQGLHNHRRFCQARPRAV